MNTNIVMLISLAFVSMYYAMCPCNDLKCNILNTFGTNTCICANCSYEYPSGYSTMNITYESQLNTSQSFYQNEKMIDECPIGLYCSKIINLNPNFTLFTNITRYTPINVINDSCISLYKLDFIKNDDDENTCSSPPELNVDFDEQDGMINSECIYEYEYTSSVDILLDMHFNDSVNIKVYATELNKLLFDETNETIYSKIESISNSFRIIVSSIMSNIYVAIFNITSLNDTINFE